MRPTSAGLAGGTQAAVVEGMLGRTGDDESGGGPEDEVDELEDVGGDDGRWYEAAGDERGRPRCMRAERERLKVRRRVMRWTSSSREFLASVSAGLVSVSILKVLIYIDYLSVVKRTS
jgi:hypothetical protein